MCSTFPEGRTGQCAAAHAICTGLRSDQRVHHLQEGVGHYGIFNGSRFRTGIAPRLRAFFRGNDRARLYQSSRRKAALVQPSGQSELSIYRKGFEALNFGAVASGSHAIGFAFAEGWKAYGSE